MRNIICFILLVVASTVYGQNKPITSDELFLQYEAAYVAYQTNISPLLSTLDKATGEFSNKFNNEKATSSFHKSKDKVKWLNKNFNKTSFKSATEAVSLYNIIAELQDSSNEKSKDVLILFEKLKLKYSNVEIHDALKERLLKE